MSTATVEVLLVDDHPVVRDGIAATLDGTGSVHICGSATSGVEAVALAAQLQPDIIVMDIGLPDINGLEATRQIVQATPAARVIILTVYDNKEYVLRAARVGARGYLVKNSTAQQLQQAIEIVHAGRLCYPDALYDLVVAEFARRGSAAAAEEMPTALSQRERQVLALIADGLSNREVAERLSLSVRTVETHRQHLMDKLDIRSVAGLTKYAISEGLTQLG